MNRSIRVVDRRLEWCVRYRDYFGHYPGSFLNNPQNQKKNFFEDKIKEKRND